jgi:hypothetical protein
MANFKTITAAAIAAAMLLGTGHPARAESLAGLHVGDSRATAFAKYGSLYVESYPDFSDKSGRARGDSWTLHDTSTLSVISRDGKIVALGLHNVTGTTGFSGISFGETTLKMIKNRFASDGVFFPGQDAAYHAGENSTWFSNSYELASSSQIITFITEVKRAGKQ